MTKRGVQKPKKKSNPAQTKTNQTPAELWGEGKWRGIKFASAIISFGILLVTVTAYSRLGDSIAMTDVLPGLMIDAVMFVVGVFFLMSPYSPLKIYGSAKYRWLFGWVFFMALISHLIANLIGLLYVFGII